MSNELNLDLTTSITLLRQQCKTKEEVIALLHKDYPTYSKEDLEEAINLIDELWMEDFELESRRQKELMLDKYY